MPIQRGALGTAEERFDRKVLKTDGCWLWEGALMSAGYGNFAPEPGRWVAAHRFSYERYVGPIPPGLQLDHLCRVRPCVRPEHLEPVTTRENCRRGERGRMVVECRQGHPYTPETTFIRSDGRRACRPCRVASARRANAKRAGTCVDCGTPISHDHARCKPCNGRLRSAKRGS